MLVGLGQDAIAQLPALLREAKANGRPLPAPTVNFLEFSIDFPGLRPWFPALARFPESELAPKNASVLAAIHRRWQIQQPVPDCTQTGRDVSNHALFIGGKQCSGYCLDARYSLF